MRMRCFAIRLLGDARDRAGTDGPPTLTDGEPLTGLERDRGNELDAHLDVVTGHDHLGAVGQADRAGDVRGPEVELGPVGAVERGVAAGLGQDLAPLNLLALDAPEQAADVVAGPALVEELLEHLDAGDDDLAGRLDPDQLDLVADLDDAALDPARGDGAPALDPEDILDRHEERLFGLRGGGGGVAVGRHT